MVEEGGRRVLLETTEEAVRLAKTLVRSARSGAIATVEPGTGWPVATRVGVSTDLDGTPVILISRLAAHTGALLADPRCSLLLGYPGKGDPLAHARVSIACEARQVERDTAEHQRLELRYLAHQQKASLYSGLGDFRYFRLDPRKVSLNAGFGRAYALEPRQIFAATDAGDLDATEPSIIEHMNGEHAEAVRLYAEHFCRAGQGNWRLVGVDAEGIDLADGDDVRRVWFDAPVNSAAALRAVLVRMAKSAREALGR